MKKGIRISAINNVAKKAALGVMLAGSVAGYATNPVKTFAENPNHTEVVSNKGAEALKALAYPILQQQKQSVPKTRNKELDARFMKLARDDEEKKFMEEFMSNVYNENGSYLASATIQQNLDLNMFYEFLDGNIEILKRFDENAYNKIDKEAMKKVTAKSEPIKQWLNENYFNVYNQPFGQFDHPPNIDEIVYALDMFVKKDPNKYFGDSFVYSLDSKVYYNYMKNSNTNEVQKYSDYIAAKVNTADFMLFKNLIESFGVYQGKEDVNILKNLSTIEDSINPLLNKIK